MAKEPTLQHRYHAYVAARRRKGRITVLLTIAAVAVGAAALRLFLQAHLDLTVQSSEELSRMSLSPEFVDEYRLLEDLRANLRSSFLFVATRSFLVPMVASLAVLLLLHHLVTEYFNTLLFRTPALATLVMQRGYPFIRTIRHFHYLAAGLFAVIIIGGLLLIPRAGTLADPPTLPKALGSALILVIALMLTSWVVRAARNSRRTAPSPVYAQRMAYAAAISFSLAALIVIAIVVLADMTTAGLAANLRSRVSTIRDTVAVHTDRACGADFAPSERELIIQEIAYVNEELERGDRLAASFTGFARQVVTRDTVACVLFMFCFVAFVGLGPTLLGVEYQSEWTALLTVPVVAVAIDYLGVALLSLYPEASWSQYLIRLLVVGATFLLGQAAGLYLKQIVDKPEACAVCSFPIHDHDERCKECGTHVQRLRLCTLVGNVESRELHDAECTHAKRLTPEKRQSFASAQEAYWQGYDNCGICLAGSGYMMRCLEAVS